MRGLHSRPHAQVIKGVRVAGSPSPGRGVGKANSAFDAFCVYCVRVCVCVCVCVFMCSDLPCPGRGVGKDNSALNAFCVLCVYVCVCVLCVYMCVSVSECWQLCMPTAKCHSPELSCSSRKLHNKQSKDAATSHQKHFFL